MECIYFEQKDISVGNDAFDHPDYQYYCNKTNCEILKHKCLKCKDKEEGVFYETVD